MNMLHLFAHSGEKHADSAEAARHLLNSWYVALPLFLLIVTGIAILTYLVSKRDVITTALVTALVLLVSGFTLYTYSAAISVVSITLGLMLAMGVTLISLQTPVSKK
jgi:type II secretory pathway component PulF